MPRPYTLGVFGPRGAGKTTLLTALYGHGQKEQELPMRIAPHGESTAQYLGPRWEMWKKQRTLPPTPLQMVDVQFQIAGNDFSNRLIVKDFGGAIIMREGGDRDEMRLRLRKMVYRFLEECQAIFLLVEYGQEGEMEKFSRRLEVEVLLEALKASFTGGEKPFGVLVTKWDKAWPPHVSPDSRMNHPAKETAQAVSYFQSHHAALSNLVQAATRHFSVFPVTVFSPHGLQAPFLWAADKIETTAWEACRKPAKKEESLVLYRRFLEETARRDLKEKAQNESKALKKALSARRKRKWVAAAFLLAVLSGLFGYGCESYRFSRFLDRVSALPSRAGFDGAIEYAKHDRPWLVSWSEEYAKTGRKFYDQMLQLSSYFAQEKDIPWRWEVYGAFLKLFPEYTRDARMAELHWKEEALYLAFVEKRDFEELRRLMVEIREDSWAEKKRDACRAFLRNHPHHPRKEMALRWEKEAQEGMERHAYASLLRDLRGLRTREKIDACSRFLQRHKNHPGATRLLDDLKEQEEEEAYAEIEKGFCGEEERIERCERYLKTPHFRKYHPEVSRLSRRLCEAWDKKLYEPILVYRFNYDLQSFAQIARLARIYQEKNKLRAMSASLEAWEKWYRKLIQGQNYDVTIKSASIGEKCKIVDSWYFWLGVPDSSVDLTFNGIRTSTQKIVDKWNPVYDKQCGPFWWKPGDQYSLQIDFTVHDSTPEIAHWVADPTRPAPYYFNQTINITSGDGWISVILTCPQAEMPALPNYTGPK